MPRRPDLLKGFRLAEWTVRPDDGSVRSDAREHRLEPLLMHLLVALCSRAGEVVPKGDLLTEVWEGRLVSDETVKSSFYQLRKLLGDNPRAPRFIETLPKRGYRMLMHPEPLEPASARSGEARELYRKGSEALTGEPNIATLKQARLYLERATQTDPALGDAWAMLAHAYIFAINFGLARGAELWPRARSAAARAMELSPNFAFAQLAQAIVSFVYERDFGRAESEFRRAMELGPVTPFLHIWFARLLSSQARHTEAVFHARLEVARDSLSLTARRELLQILFMARRYEETEAGAQQVFDLLPASAEVQLGMVWVYCVNGKEREAFGAFAAGLQSLGVAPALLEQAQGVFNSGGMRAVLRIWADLLEREASLGQRNQVDLLSIYGLLGERDRCFALLDFAADEHHPQVMFTAVSPLLDSVRDDPRYPALLRRLGFGPNLFPTSKPPSA